MSKTKENLYKEKQEEMETLDEKYQTPFGVVGFQMDIISNSFKQDGQS